MHTQICIFSRLFSITVYAPDGPPGRSRGGCMRCQQSRSLQLAVKVLYGVVAFLVIAVVVLASLGEPALAEHVAPSVNKQNSTLICSLLVLLLSHSRRSAGNCLLCC